MLANPRADLSAQHIKNEPESDAFVELSGLTASSMPITCRSAMVSPCSMRTMPPWSGGGGWSSEWLVYALAHSLPPLAIAQSCRTQITQSPGTITPPVILTR